MYDMDFIHCHRSLVIHCVASHCWLLQVQSDSGNDLISNDDHCWSCCLRVIYLVLWYNTWIPVRTWYRHYEIWVNTLCQVRLSGVWHPDSYDLLKNPLVQPWSNQQRKKAWIVHEMDALYNCGSILSLHGFTHLWGCVHWVIAAYWYNRYRCEWGRNRRHWYLLYEGT